MGPPLISSFWGCSSWNLSNQAVTIYASITMKKRSIQINSVSSDRETEYYKTKTFPLCNNFKTWTSCFTDVSRFRYFKGIYGSNSDRIHKADTPCQSMIFQRRSSHYWRSGWSWRAKQLETKNYDGLGDLEVLKATSLLTRVCCHSPLEILETLKIGL